jgi:hypothetical protein
MMNLSSRGLPMRPEQNPLAQRREQMNAQRQPLPMQKQMMQAQALRQDPTAFAAPQLQLRGSF